MNIIIGIQARSTSERLPRKHHEMIGRKRLLDHVIDGCQSAKNYVNRKLGNVCEVFVLTPEGDPIGQDFASTARMFYGPELDVLKRYVDCAIEHEATHMIRVTGDCPLIPPFIISKAILLGISSKYDYLSNVDHRCRSTIDGTDVEFMTARFLRWLDDHTLGGIREHVTMMGREKPPPWAKIGLLGGYFDHSDIKLSVDTEEDLERTRQAYNRSIELYNKAREHYPRYCIHRI